MVNTANGKRAKRVAVTDLVIFDCDGVLVDTESLGVKIDVQVLASLGWALSEEEVVRRVLGVSAADFRRAIEHHLGRVLPDDWENEFEPLYRRAYEAELRPVAGIVEALDRIGQRTCVASSGSHDKMRFTLGLVGLYDRFAGRIFSGTEVAHGKPAPDLFLYAATQMGADPSSCIVVEDSVNGVRAARAAGMRVLGFGGGLLPPQLLEDAGAHVFMDMSLLPELISNGHGSVV
jgi:HAD superfamily hydrolase (TIGR01509 family)